jgi:hypothetical protein
MLRLLEKRSGRCGGARVIVDRGMAYEENLAQIKARGHHYLVANRYLAPLLRGAPWAA